MVKLLKLNSRRQPSILSIALTLLLLFICALGYLRNVYVIMTTDYAAFWDSDAAAVSILLLRLIGTVLYPIGIFMGIYNG